MSRRSAEIEVGQPIERVAEKFIASLGGDATAAVTELIAIVQALIEENRAWAA